jgi:hypothetical protein
MEQGELRAPVIRPDLVYRPLVDGRVFVYHPKIASQILDPRAVAALKLCHGQSLYGMLPEVRVAMDFDLSEEEWKTFVDRLTECGFFEGIANRDPRRRLFDPGPIIEFVNEKGRWLFSTPVVVLLFGVLAASLVQLGFHWETFVNAVESATGMHAFLSVFLFYLCFVPVGLLHELGHGVVCGRFGGEVLEVGVSVDSANLYVSSNKAPLTTARARIIYLAGGVFTDMLVFFLLLNIWLRWPSYGTLIFLLPQALFFLQFSYAMEKNSDLSRIISEWTGLPEAKGRWGFVKDFLKSRPKSSAEWKRAAVYLGSIVLQLAVAATLIWAFRHPTHVKLWSGAEFSVPFWPPLLYLIYRTLRKGATKLSARLMKPA